MDPGNAEYKIVATLMAASLLPRKTGTLHVPRQFFLERPDVAVQLGSGLWWKTGEEPPITKRKHGFLKNTLKSTDFQSSPISLGARGSFSFQRLKDLKTSPAFVLLLSWLCPFEERRKGHSKSRDKGPRRLNKRCFQFLLD